MHHTTRSLPRLFPLAVVLVVLAACSGSTAGAPGASAAAASAPAAGRCVTTPEAAVERIVALEPRLAGIAAQDPDTVGASSWYVATPTDDGYDVEVYVGWGDCMAGCIEDHTWMFSVTRDGAVELLSEQGQAVPDAAWPSPGGAG
jgi:hypothetical protein